MGQNRVKPGHRPTLGAGLASLSTLLAGATVFAAKQVSEEMDELLLTAFRVSIGLVCISPLIVRAFRQVPGRMALKIILMGAVSGGLTPWAITEGLARTDATTSAIVLCSTPIFTLLLAQILRREDALVRHWLGASVTFVGLAVCLAPDPGWKGPDTPDLAIGLMLLIAAAIASAFFNVLVRQLVATVGPTALTVLSVLGGTALLTVLLTISAGNHAVPDLSSLPWLLLVFVGAGSAAQSFLWIAAMRFCEAGRISPLIALSPVSTLALEACVLGKTIQYHSIAGSCLILIGLSLALGPCQRLASLCNCPAPQSRTTRR